MSAIIETFLWCPSNEGDVQKFTSSDGSEEYTCTYGAHNAGPYQMNWSCTCKGFQFRKTCKHVKQAEDLRCGHGWEAAAGSPADYPDGKCPSCGKRPVPVRVAI